MLWLWMRCLGHRGSPVRSNTNQHPCAAPSFNSFSFERQSPPHLVIPFRWTCFPASCAILASGHKETARLEDLEVLDCALCTSHDGTRRPGHDMRQGSPGRRRSVRKVSGLREWRTFCACCLWVCFGVFAFALLWCFDLIAQIWAWAGRKADRGHPPIDNDLLLGWLLAKMEARIVVVVRTVIVGIVIPE